jgi:hypothetical protein
MINSAKEQLSWSPNDPVARWMLRHPKTLVKASAVLIAWATVQGFVINPVRDRDALKKDAERVLSIPSSPSRHENHRIKHLPAPAVPLMP